MLPALGLVAPRTLGLAAAASGTEGSWVSRAGDAPNQPGAPSAAAAARTAARRPLAAAASSPPTTMPGASPPKLVIAEGNYKTPLKELYDQ